ncbi:MAG: hypothetical protein AAFX00_06975 [Pseudomonadota bacterium]
MALAGSIVWLAEAWLWVGAAVAAVFVTWGIDRIDEDAQGAYAFRPLIVPGVMLLWPLVLWRWYVLESGRDDWAKRHDPPRRAHTWAALVMSGLILLALGAGLTVRQSWPADVAPVQLAQPGQGS